MASSLGVATIGRRVLALDLATTTGYCYAVLDDEMTLVSHGSRKLKRPSQASGMVVAGLYDLLGDFAPEVVVAEAQGRSRSHAAARMAHGLSMAAEHWCHQRGIRWLKPVPSSTIKRTAALFAGRDRASLKGKVDALDAATKILGREIDDSDEADAIALMLHAFQNMKGDWEWETHRSWY